MDKNKGVIILELFLITIFSLIFGVGLGNILVGNLNLLDEGQFASWPYQMLLGKKMFADIFIMYGPLYVYPLFIFSKVFGVSFFNIRIFFFIEGLLAIFAAYFLCLKLNFKHISRLFIIFLLVILPGIQIRQGIALIAVYFLLIANTQKNKIWTYLAGVLNVVTFLVSPEIGIYLAFAAIFYFLTDLKNNFKKGKILGYFLAIVSTAAVFEFWASRDGWFFPYTTTTLSVLKNFSGINSPLGQNFPNLIAFFPRTLNLLNFLKFIFSPEALMYWGILFLILGFVYFFVKIIIRKLTKKDTQILPIYILALFSYLSVVGRASINNMYFILPFGLIVGAYFIELIILEFKPWNKNIQRKLVPALTILILLMIPLRMISINRTNMVSNLKMLVNYNSYIPISDKDFLRISPLQEKYLDDIKKIANEKTKRNDSIFVLQDEPGLYVVAERKNASKYDLPYFANSYKLRAEVLNELKIKRPKIIIWNPSAWAVDNISNYRRLPEVVKYIEASYNKDQINGVIIFQLR